MYDELILATEVILDEGLFIPYNPIQFGNALQFELHVNALLLNQLGNAYSRNSIDGYGGRRFDLKRYHQLRNQWMVCEIGHEKSSRGYLYSPNGTPNQMGIINKLFFDYIRNFQFDGFAPESYALLYFSIEAGANLIAVDELFDTIIHLYPVNHLIRTFDVNSNDALCAKILIIDHLNNIDDVRNIYQPNHHIQQFVNPVERGWNKHDILMGYENPWQ